LSAQIEQEGMTIMNDEEIAQKIQELTNEQKDVLYQLCDARRDQPGTDVAVYVVIAAEIARELHDKDLVWLLVVDRRQAAVRHDVYKYWRKHSQAI
jgi:hypothetical protein